MRLTILGAAREVTGSSYLIESGSLRFLVDCGMFQGRAPEAAARNRQPFAFDPGSLDFVLLTHAHIDHSGLLPRLTREGFGGPIHATEATADLLEVMLPDSAHIQEIEAARRPRGRHQAFARPVSPIYTLRDADACLRQVARHPYDQRIAPHPDVTCIFRNAGHILGSAIIELWLRTGRGQVKLVFSGDLGQPGRPILHDPARVDEADILVMESTYGDRSHPDQAATLTEMAAVIADTFRRGGNVVIPAFAVGRTQEMIYHLHCLARQGRLRDLSIFVDSPMADRATQITKSHLALFDEEARNLVDWHENAADRPQLHFTASTAESMAINEISGGAIIISASGMCDAGRIRHHLRHNLPRPESTVLITGFQAQGTLGRRLVDGATRVRLFGEEIPVRAQVRTLNGFSAHADRKALLDWARGFRRAPAQVLVTHGEESVAENFAATLCDAFGWNAIAPEPDETLHWPPPS